MRCPVLPKSLLRVIEMKLFVGQRHSLGRERRLEVTHDRVQVRYRRVVGQLIRVMPHSTRDFIALEDLDSVEARFEMLYVAGAPNTRPDDGHPTDWPFEFAATWVPASDMSTTDERTERIMATVQTAYRPTAIKAGISACGPELRR
ncbi:unnamed protein product [Mycena citricolor]|uniref:Uncharacterized protein n=1 Tax=Mycena citricolor TaxID=2018698 RepID=A0AAD2HIZ3_9AGAR|nr:unnamed protein product [Mycena citricolor]